jgi:hypothetical protein
MYYTITLNGSTNITLRGKGYQYASCGLNVSDPFSVKKVILFQLILVQGTLMDTIFSTKMLFI